MADWDVVWGQTHVANEPRIRRDPNSPRDGSEVALLTVEGDVCSPTVKYLHVPTLDMFFCRRWQMRLPSTRDRMHSQPPGLTTAVWAFDKLYVWKCFLWKVLHTFEHISMMGHVTPVTYTNIRHYRTCLMHEWHIIQVMMNAWLTLAIITQHHSHNINTTQPQICWKFNKQILKHASTSAIKITIGNQVHNICKKL